MELNIDLKIWPTRPKRVTVFNLKSDQGKQYFIKLKTDRTEFTDCFVSMQPQQNQCEDWQKTVISYCKQSFPKIRVWTGKFRKSEADKPIKKTS